MKDPIYNTEKYCKLANLTTSKGYKRNANFSIYLSNDTDAVSRWLDYDLNGSEKIYETAKPNIALLSVILLMSTCFMALLLKKLRRSNFLGSYVSFLFKKYLNSYLNKPNHMVRLLSCILTEIQLNFG